MEADSATRKVDTKANSPSAAVAVSRLGSEYQPCEERGCQDRQQDGFLRCGHVFTGLGWLPEVDGDAFQD